MTCIVGLVDNGIVYIGGDSCGSDGRTSTIRAEEKVFRNGEFLFGFTSSFRMGGILRYSFKPPECKTWDVWRYMNTTFIDAVREAFKSGGYLQTESGRESGGDFLVGFRGQLFVIESDFQIGVPACSYEAVGCGRSHALGSLFSTVGMQAERRGE